MKTFHRHFILAALLVSTAGFSVACSARTDAESGAAEANLTDAVDVKVLESDGSSGVLRSTIKATVASTTLEKAADTLLTVSGWKDLKDEGRRVFTRTKRDSDEGGLANDGDERTIEASVYVTSSAGEIQFR
jgi:hypothetical protein